MKIQLKVTKDSPVQVYRHYAILREGEQVGTLSRGTDRRWNAQLVRNRNEAWGLANQTAYAHSNFQAIIRLISCYLEGDDERLPYLMRGIWTNPCPTPEIVA
jgi:hypothetical protein